MAKNVNFNKLVRSSTNNEAPLEGEFDRKFTTDELAYRMPRQRGSERNNAIQESMREGPVRHPYRTFKNTRKNAAETHNMRDNLGGRKRKSRGKRTKKGKKANKKSANKRKSRKKSKKTKKGKKAKKGKKSKKIKKTKKGGMDSNSNEAPATPPSGTSTQGIQPPTPGGVPHQQPFHLLGPPVLNNAVIQNDIVNADSDDDSAVLPPVPPATPPNQNNNNVDTPMDTESDSDEESFTSISSNNSQQEIEEETR